VLEQSMPVLAGALRDGGLTLTGGGVFEQPRDPRQAQGEHPGQGRAPSPGASGAGGAAGDGGTADAEPARPAALPRGMVDVYA
jgi:flagellar hook-length control protein FliK